MYKKSTLINAPGLKILELFLDLERHYFAEISKKTGISRPSTMRTLRQFVKEDVMTVKKEANVKYYALKKNTITYTLLAAVEYHITLIFLEKSKTLQRALEMIEEKQSDILISIIFGSYAKGSATKSSDIDLLLIKEQFSKKDVKNVEDIIDLVNGRTGLKISPHIMTLEELKARNELAEEVIRKHVLLDGAELFFKAVLP